MIRKRLASPLGARASRVARALAPLPLLLVLLLTLAPRTAHAEQLLIKYPGNHPHYVFEAEPHGLVGFGGPFGSSGFPGVGFRGTVIIVDDGFVKSINNSVGISFGADIFFGRGGSSVLIPVAMQWNFWLSTHWSVFGEPGVAFSSGRNLLHPVFAAGGRYHFTERIALTMRVGYPAVSVGVSFLF